jgi:hypothetical protein
MDVDEVPVMQSMTYGLADTKDIDGFPVMQSMT